MAATSATRRILEALAAIAPLTAVRGNNDRAAWAEAVPETGAGRTRRACASTRSTISRSCDIDPAAAGVRVVVSGHSHRPLAEERDGVLYVNPGSAGPRRFRLPISAARAADRATARSAPRIVELVIG